jgi:hypothetical protein
VASYSLTALVLKKTKLGETDLILTLLGEDGALHKAVAKGARKPGSKFGGRGEPATLLTALVARGKSLDIITDAKTIDTHRALREDYDATLAMSVMLDFAATLSQESLADERFFGLTVAALEALEQVLDDRLNQAGQENIKGRRDDESDGAVAAPDSVVLALSMSAGTIFTSERITLILVAYLIKASAMHGFRPDFDPEVFADSEVKGDGRKEASFESQHAEARMSYDDRHFDTGFASGTDQSVMKYLAYLLGATFAEILAVDSLEMPDTSALMNAMRHFIRENIPARIKALDFYVVV